MHVPQDNFGILNFAPKHDLNKILGTKKTSRVSARCAQILQIQKPAPPEPPSISYCTPPSTKGTQQIGDAARIGWNRRIACDCSMPRERWLSLWSELGSAKRWSARVLFAKYRIDINNLDPNKVVFVKYRIYANHHSSNRVIGRWIDEPSVGTGVLKCIKGGLRMIPQSPKQVCNHST